MSAPWWTELTESRDSLPPVALLCGDRLSSTGIWWRSSRNHGETEARSCMHAVRFRDRLGSGANGGIPLWAELKSLVGFARDSVTAVEIPFAAHTRANTHFSDMALVTALGLNPTTTLIVKLFDDSHLEAPVEKVAGQIDGATAWFGRVNPFNIDLIVQDGQFSTIGLPAIYQVFDESLLLDGGTPDTVMTNLGERLYAFEANPKELIAAVSKIFPNTIVARISGPDQIWLGLQGTHPKDYWLNFPPPKGPKIGILTGNSPESGITLWQDILKVLRGLFPNLPDTLMPAVIVYSVPAMGLSMELVEREQEVRNVVIGNVNRLLSEGCKLITLACNTTIYFEPEINVLCKEWGARFVSIAEGCMPAVRSALLDTGANAVGLVGIGPVVDFSGHYSGYKRWLESEGIPVTPCPADELAFEFKSRGTVDRLLSKFRNLVSNSLPTNEPVVILALTELSIIYRDHQAKTPEKKRSSRVFIDPLQELAKYLCFTYLSSGYRECDVCQVPVTFDVEKKLSTRLGWKTHPHNS
jgi:aspartate/glutamate racemase